MTYFVMKDLKLHHFMTCFVMKDLNLHPFMTCFVMKDLNLHHFMTCFVMKDQNLNHFLTCFVMKDQNLHHFLTCFVMKDLNLNHLMTSCRCFNAVGSAKMVSFLLLQTGEKDKSELCHFRSNGIVQVDNLRSRLFFPSSKIYRRFV